MDATDGTTDGITDQTGMDLQDSQKEQPSAVGISNHNMHQDNSQKTNQPIQTAEERAEIKDYSKQIEEMDRNLKYWQEKYTRSVKLLEGHRKLQSVNQSLEDKLLGMAQRSEIDKKNAIAHETRLEKELDETKRKLAQVERLNELNEKNCLIASQNETSPKSSSPANDTRCPSPSRSTMRVPIPTFPPKATMYTVDRKQRKRDSSNEEDFVTAPLMGKVLDI